MAPTILPTSPTRARDETTGHRQRQAWSSEEDKILLEALRQGESATRCKIWGADTVGQAR